MHTREAGPKKAGGGGPGAVPPSSPRSFWWGFVAGWSVYVVLLATTELTDQPGQIAQPLLSALLGALPPIAVSALVAANRHRLLRPEWGLAKTFRVHAVVGLAFAVVDALLLLGLTEVTGFEPSEFAQAGPGTRFALFMVSSLFLYVIFIGILMWSESVRRVRESHAAAAREAVLRAEAEAKAVRAQFNPHFVFNTLHSLMLLVRADPAAAERAIEDVATLIRYASIVQRGDLDVVPLAKELEVARRYVDLEMLRLEDRLSVEWQVAEDSSGVAIPAFALQTLVENAIKHGIEPKVGGGRVVVRVERVDPGGGVLRITVVDDGVGAEPSRVQALAGHGLDLLGRRFRSRYGEAGRVEWTTAPGGGFQATLRLPAEMPTHETALDVIDARSDRPGSLQAAVPSASTHAAGTDRP